MSTTWNIDTSHSSIGFTIRHMMFTKVRGSFSDWDAVLRWEPNNIESASVVVSIDTKSINTGNAKRDGHLQSGDFFDVEKFPTMRFTSERVERVDDSNFRVIGALTIRDTTREVVLDVEHTGQGQDPWGNLRTGFSATTTIHRKDYGLTWNQALETGGVLVGDKVTINLDIQAIGVSAQAAASATA